MITWNVESMDWVEADRNWRVSLSRINFEGNRVNRVAFYYERRLSFNVGDSVDLKA